MQANWYTLLNPLRFRPTSGVKHIFDGRNDFENDYTRIILSPHFRRLQDKAQVFPYDDSDFVRTRLTHSLEVSNFARSLGLSVENQLTNDGEFPTELNGHISSVLAASGLIHDLGNPPFGHFGEECIQTFFKTSGNSYLENLSIEEQQDFLNYEGNAQTFRILLKLGPAPDAFSYNLTFPTLICTMKYPVSSSEGNKRKLERISRKKFGYFRSEEAQFNEITETLKIGNNRHPLVFLLEAADDIAYSVSDIEDGCKKKIITKDILIDTIEKTLSGNEAKKQKDLISKIESELPKNHPSRFTLLIQRFRIKSHSDMLKSATRCYLKNYKDILSGNFDVDLILNSDAAELRELFKTLGDINFNHESVIKREIAGQAALKFHLETFASVLFSKNLNNRKSFESKLINFISKNYRFIHENYEKYPNPDYKKLLLLTDFISGMTDSFAIKLYHHLSGIAPY